jgi:hypothetical protein
MALSEHFWNKAREYVRAGNRVSELYHAERDDILRGLAEIVTDEGIVYGVDHLNPFERHANMQELQKLSNVKLLRASIPPLPAEVSNLDAVLVREFIWTYPLPYDGSENVQTYEAIDTAVNVGGHLILHLNPTEQENERGKHPMYQDTMNKQLPHFQKVYDSEDLMVYQKASSRTSDRATQ